MQCFSCEGLFSETLSPFMLSCGHTVCFRCVANIQNEKIPCPHCLRPVRCSFPNLTLCSQTNPNPLPQFCELCDDQEHEPHTPTFKCIDCNQFLCESMVRMHKKVKALSLHNLIPLSELSVADVNSVLPRLYPKKCQIHNHPFTHYNESTEGSHLLCVYCAAETANKGFPSLPLSSASLSPDKVQQAREYSPKISDRITSLSSASQTISDKIKSLNESRDLALGQIEQTFQTYRQALDAREAELKSRVKELHKSALFEMEDELERARLFVGQLEQYAKGLEEMEAALTLTSTSNSTAISSSVPESVLVDVCLLEASLRSSFSHSMEVKVSQKERVGFRVSDETGGLREKLSGLGKVSLIVPSSRILDPIDLSEMTLLLASEKEELEVVRALLDRGDDVNQKDKYGFTPLHIASKKGRLSIASLLLDRGANIHEKNKDEYTPLHWATRNGHPLMATYLVERGANIHEKNKDGRTTLHLASLRGHLPLVSLLLDKGARINEKDKDGYTPLHSASTKGHLSIVSLLIVKGANINEKDKSRNTPLNLAKNGETKALLTQREGNIEL